MTLNHIHLGTRDLKAIQAFYEKYFGFKKKYDHGEGVFLVDSSNFLIAIDPVETLPVLPDWYHLGFCLEGEDVVLNLYEKMKSANEPIVRDMKRSPNEFASFYVKDPDGNKIEVSWHNE